MKKLVCSIMLILLASGCAPSGHKLDFVKLQQIEEGVTTKQEIISLLGDPTFITLNPEGSEIITYHYVQAKGKARNFVPVINAISRSTNVKQQIVQVLLNENDIVDKYVYSNSESVIKSGLINAD